MPKRLCLIALLASLSASAANTVTLGNKTFTLPEGFTIELLAGPELAGRIDRPITMDFDEQGRLYVADSSGTSAKAADQLKSKPHQIVRLEDTDGDGLFDKRTIFADKMMFPEGTMWYQGSLYVAAPPSIWKLTDTDGDGIADQRSEWFDGKTLTGCANDLHGPYLGPDGWFYWCKGAFAKQTYTLPNGKPFETRAAHIFRARPDGTGLEPFITGGMDNPVDVAFTPSGEAILSCTFLQNPAGGKRDGLLHAVYGGVYGKVHDVLDGHIRTSPDVLPVLSHLGPSASCGLHRYESAAFGKDAGGVSYTDNLFSCSFNLHKVFRHVLTPEGSTFNSKNEDFLTCENVDFHPTDVIEDADGSLLIADTGGWYKLCCPTSQMAKADVLGGIYRVRRKDAAKVEDARGLQLAWDKLDPAGLAKLLDDDRPAVRKRAIETMAKRATRGGTGVPPVKNVERQNNPQNQAAQPAEPVIDLSIITAMDRVLQTGSPRARVNAVWTACRIPGMEARATIRAAMGDKDENVQIAALHAASIGRDSLAAPEAAELLKHRSAHIRRNAAVVVGRSAKLECVGPLLAAMVDIGGEVSDRFLEHSLVNALHEIDPFGKRDVDYAVMFSDARKPGVQRLLLMVIAHAESELLSNMLDKATRDAFMPGIESAIFSADFELRKAAAWAMKQRPRWIDAIVISMKQRLDKPRRSFNPAARQSYISEDPQPFVVFVSVPEIRELLGEVVGDAERFGEQRRFAMSIMAAAKPAELPASWLKALMRLSMSAEVDNAEAAVATLVAIAPRKGFSAENLVSEFMKVAARSSLSDLTRLQALSLLPPATGKSAAAGKDREPLSPALAGFLLSQLDSTKPQSTRLLAAEIIGRSKFSAEQFKMIVGVPEFVGPIELERLLPVFDQPAVDDKLALELIDELAKAKSAASLRPDSLRHLLKRFGPEVQKKAEPLLAKLAPDSAKQKEKLEALEKTLPQGDARNGQQIFASAKAACSSCHAIGYVGGNIGPDLTKIGAIRQPRDLLESIVFPSASFVQSFEPTILEMEDGDVVSGIVKGGLDAEEITLQTGPGEPTRLARKSVKAMRPGQLSIMPAGLDQQLTPQELADLLAFLRGCK